jgi:hypothetical protein
MVELLLYVVQIIRIRYCKGIVGELINNSKPQ